MILRILPRCFEQALSAYATNGQEVFRVPLYRAKKDIYLLPTLNAEQTILASQLEAIIYVCEKLNVLSGSTIGSTAVLHLHLVLDGDFFARTSAGDELTVQVCTKKTARCSINVPPFCAKTKTRLSRVIGALGQQATERYVDQKIIIVGTGRNGSVIANPLVQLGCDVCFIDADHIESHNTDMGLFFSEESIGAKKAEHLEAMFRKTYTQAKVSAVALSLGSFPALGSISSATIIICCVDNGYARLLANLLARAFLIPLLDVGSSVQRKQGQLFRGGDVRFCVPGGACLLCMGGVGATTVESSWQVNRAGSLAGINHTNIGLGLSLIEDYMAYRIEQSAWVRYEEIQGDLSLRRSGFESQLECPACGLSGVGNAIYDRLKQHIYSCLRWQL